VVVLGVGVDVLLDADREDHLEIPAMSGPSTPRADLECAARSACSESVASELGVA
jgi:hypothetical protein